MYKIVKKACLNPSVTMMDIEAPFVAAKAEPGQFIILRVDEEGERIPLTVAGYDREKGTVRKRESLSRILPDLWEWLLMWRD